MKRGQVTIFVIIGVILLISAGLILYIRSKMTTTDPVPERDPVQTYMEQCITLVAEEGLSILGLQGGYIKVDELDPLSAQMDPFNSQALYSSGIVVPYWFYQDRMGQEKTGMPRLNKLYEGDNSIQSQLEEYMDENIDECVDLEVFSGLEVEKTGNHSFDVLITESDVNFRANYPLEIRAAEDLETQKTFTASVPVRLGHIYSLAKDIRDYEMEEVFLERNTMNLISIYSRVDDDYLPPMYGGFRFESCSDRVFWIYTEVEKDLRQMLSANLPYLKVADTDFEPIIIQDPDEDRREFRQAVYDKMIYSVSENIYPFLEVGFDYEPFFPMELDFGSKGILQPNSFELDMIFSQICMMEYKFGYNLRYPVMVTITDDKSNIDNQPYYFQYPMQVILKYNFPRVSYASAYLEEDLVEVPSQCDRKFWQEELEVSVADSSGQMLDDVELRFQCGPSMVYEYDINGSVSAVRPFAEVCYIGETDSGIYDSGFPACSRSGMLTVQKDGYVTRTFVTEPIDGQDMTITLDRVYDLDVNVNKVFLKPSNVVMSGSVACTINDEPSPLQTYESALVQITKTDLENGEIKGPSVAFFSPGNSSVIRIAPGTYEVDIMLLRNERYNGEMTIRKDSESISYSDGFSGDKTITYPDEDVLIPSAFTGGAHFMWTVGDDELRGKDTITFTIFDEGPPKIIEEIGAPLEHRQGCSALNENIVRPRLQ